MDTQVEENRRFPTDYFRRSGWNTFVVNYGEHHQVGIRESQETGSKCLILHRYDRIAVVDHGKEFDMPIYFLKDLMKILKSLVSYKTVKGVAAQLDTSTNKEICNKIFYINNNRAYKVQHNYNKIDFTKPNQSYWIPSRLHENLVLALTQLELEL